ncbi:MAG: hypothetical protein R3202_01905 [Candidatus Competibacterales bacterium]|nr:hypothetical protein [Candidatus Competibacterales bacterium]
MVRFMRCSLAQRHEPCHPATWFEISLNTVGAVTVHSAKDKNNARLRSPFARLRHLRTVMEASLMTFQKNPVPTVSAPAVRAAAGLLALCVATAATAQISVDTRRISLTTIGEQANSNSGQAAFSRDGNFIVFVSDASNLVVGDTSNSTDIFRFDQSSNQLTEVTLDQDNSLLPSVSANGRFVAFQSNATGFQDSDGDTLSDSNGADDIYLRDMQSGGFELISRNNSGSAGNGDSVDPRISADGRFVVFASIADDLASGDTNGTADIFVYDRDNDTMTRVSLHSNGSQANDGSFDPDISDDGRFVVFASGADNLVNNDNNGVIDIFVRDRQRGETVRVSVDSNGFEANDSSLEPKIAGDGRLVVFVSPANNLAPGDSGSSFDVIVHDRETGETTSPTVGNTDFTDPRDPTISTNGSEVAFSAVPEPTPTETFDRQVYWHDRETSETVLLSASFNDATRPGNNVSTLPAIAGAGTRVAYGSEASDLVSGDSNAFQDVFLSEISMTSMPPPPSDTETSLRNISTNGPVDSRGMIAGFIVEEAGTFAILAESEGPDPIDDAVLDLEGTTASGSFSDSNDDWDQSRSAEFQDIIGRTPGQDSDAALIVDLEAGVYLATITGKNGDTGTGIVAVNQARSQP